MCVAQFRYTGLQIADGESVPDFLYFSQELHNGYFGRSRCLVSRSSLDRLASERTLPLKVLPLISFCVFYSAWRWVYQTIAKYT